METDGKSIRRELEKSGYSKHVIIEVFKWYQPSKQNRGVAKKKKKKFATKNESEQIFKKSYLKKEKEGIGGRFRH